MSATPSSSAPSPAATTSTQRFAATVLEAVSSAIVGVDQELELLLLGMLARGHVLVEDVPGTGKTTAVRAFGVVTGFDTGRVQCTPDLLPTEVTGVNIFDQSSGGFSFRPGPMFHTLLLVDEINRATPRTQSALLEAMAERQVTVDGTSHDLDEAFTVIATQNPIEQAGTFPLPEAQLDRFLLRLSFGYPDLAAHRTILRGRRGHEPLAELEQQVDGPGELPKLWAEIDQVHVDEDVETYMLALIQGLRDHGDVAVGPSVRAALVFERAARALAATQGREHVLPDDVKRLARPTLAHRLVLREDAGIHGREPGTIVDEALWELDVPVRPSR